MKEGGITENASYFVFKQSADGAFEAFPLHEWYNFTPVAKYKSLNAEVMDSYNYNVEIQRKWVPG